MRTVGQRVEPRIRLAPSADALEAAGVHQETVQALAAVLTVGYPKVIYRFRTHEERNRFDETASARVVAANVRARGGR